MKPNQRSPQERLRRMNVPTSIGVVGPVGVLLIVTDASTWWHVVVLGVGLAAALLAGARWTPVGISRVVLPCVLVTAAVWVAGVLAVGGHTAFYPLCVAAGPYVPKLPRYRWLAAAGLVVFVAAVGAARLLVAEGDPAKMLFSYVLAPAGTTLLITGAMFAGQAFYDLVVELDEARKNAADLAVVRERVRFASDLHDIQGHTLHVVKLKVTLAEKLVRADPDRAEQELREIHALVGDTITQTKELAYAQRRLNLSAELENAKNLFEAAGIRVLVERESDVDTEAGELLGQVLRETTTNILRHAEAGQVRITLSRSGIAIVNDGATDAPLPELRGLSTLMERVAGAGGELTVEQRDGRFHTVAELADPPAATSWRTTR